MNESAQESAVLALALARLEGVGRVSAGRLTSRFASAGELRTTPREQVLVRLPGIPSADRIVDRIASEVFETHLAAARDFVEGLRQRDIHVLTCRHPSWPKGFGDLDWSQRPAHLFVFGDPRLLSRTEVAFLAQPPLQPEAYEKAQALAKRLMSLNAVIAVGMNPGFDTVACKFAVAANSPLVLMAASGLAKVPGPIRPAASAVGKAGGIMVSSFEMNHGPFEHDQNERALLMAAVCRTVVMVGAPEGSPDSRAFEWAKAHSRNVIDLPGAERARSLDELVEVAALPAP